MFPADVHHVPLADGPDHFTPLSRGSRSRVMSSSSVSISARAVSRTPIHRLTLQAPAASPYLPATSAFPTDPRAHALSQPQAMDRYPPIRYDSHIYPASATHSPTTSNQPPPHNLPRSGLGYEHMDMYSGGRDDVGSTWGPDVSLNSFMVVAILFSSRFSVLADADRLAHHLSRAPCTPCPTVTARHKTSGARPRITRTSIELACRQQKGMGERKRETETPCEERR